MNESQRYAVYHANDVLEANLPPAMRWYADTSMYYTHIADIVAPLEQVFPLTNHIDHPWTDNPEVVWFATSRIRSTSVGDIIVSSESGQVWLSCPWVCRNSRRSWACIQAIRTPQTHHQ